MSVIGGNKGCNEDGGGEDYTALSTHWVEDDTWPEDVCTLGYWGPGTLPPCNEDAYYYYHADNLSHTTYGLGNFSSITIDYNMDVSWLGDIRTALSVTI